MCWATWLWSPNCLLNCKLETITPCQVGKVFLEVQNNMLLSRTVASRINSKWEYYIVKMLILFTVVDAQTEWSMCKHSILTHLVTSCDCDINQQNVVNKSNICKQTITMPLSPTIHVPMSCKVSSCWCLYPLKEIDRVSWMTMRALVRSYLSHLPSLLLSMFQPSNLPWSFSWSCLYPLKQIDSISWMCSLCCSSDQDPVGGRLQLN